MTDPSTIPGHQFLSADALVKCFPTLDYMMAETLIKAHAAGKLAEYNESLEKPAPQPESCVLQTVTVENFSPPEDKKDAAR